MNVRVLLTGGGGFLGSRVAHFLSREGAIVVAPRRDELDVSRELADFGKIDVVVHLAARTFVPESWKYPGLFYQINSGGTVNVLDYCRRSGASMLFVSAYCYGSPTNLPISEDTPLRPSNPYAFSKVAAEEACRYFSSEFGIRTVTLRPFNIFGSGQDERFLIPTILRQVLADDVPAIELADCRPRRDYVHVDDVAGAIVIAALRPDVSGVYNVGSGCSHSVGEVAELILAAAGRSKPIVDRQEIRENEIMDTIADISAADRDLGWRPRISLAAGLANLVATARS